MSIDPAKEMQDVHKCMRVLKAAESRYEHSLNGIPSTVCAHRVIHTSGGTLRVVCGMCSGIIISLASA